MGASHVQIRLPVRQSIFVAPRQTTIARALFVIQAREATLADDDFLSSCRQSCERQSGGSGETDPKFDRGTAFDSADTITAHIRRKPADIDKRAKQSCYIAWPAALGRHRSIRHTASASLFIDAAQHQRTSAIIRQDDFFPSGGAVARHREDARI